MLDLSDRGLTTLRQGISQLAGLKELYLDGNPIATLPAELWSMAGLESLSLDGCKLTAVPQAIGGLTALRELNLGYNKGLQSLPWGLLRCANLEELGLNYCPKLEALNAVYKQGGVEAVFAQLREQAAPAFALVAAQQRLAFAAALCASDNDVLANDVLATVVALMPRLATLEVCWRATQC